jgi:hypothetical protein
MNAPPFPPNPSFGQYFGNWVWSGSRWVCTNTNGVRIVVQKFFASAPYTPSPGLITAMVEAWGGGGAGGGVGAPASNECLGGSGGGSGGYSRIALASGLVLGGVNVTIGAGGAFGGDNGQALPGQATSFGALCVANGSIGGWAMFPSVSNPEPGGGAPPGIGDLALPGATGTPGYWLVFATANTNFSAATPLGGQIAGGNSGLMIGAGSGSDGLFGAANTGAGGAGATINQMATPTSFAGGGGGSGLCIVTEYCWADAVDDGCGCGPTGMARVAAPTGWQGGFDND